MNVLEKIEENDSLSIHWSQKLTKNSRPHYEARSKNLSHARIAATHAHKDTTTTTASRSMSSGSVQSTMVSATLARSNICTITLPSHITKKV